MTTHYIPATKETVTVGVIDQGFAPILTVDPGDEVKMQTWGLWANAVKPGMSYDEVMAIKAQYQGKGPHSITGPIQVRGAKAGMTLKVDILDLQLGPHGFNMITHSPHSRGLLTHEFPEGEIRHFIFDLERMETDFVNGIKLPLTPFLGIVGVAPADPGPHISSVPGPFGGNIDCIDFVPGTTVYFPVWVDGALFYAGDAHAMQGSGEVTQTALETSFDCAHLRLDVLPQHPLKRPHAETDQYLITMGFHQDLREAAVQAVSDMVLWLSSGYGLNRSDAYVLCSLQADLLITQAVNNNNGVHVRLPKSLLRSLQAN